MSKKSCVRPWKVRLRPALMPCGGSAVYLIDICSKPIGNLWCSSVVIHNRKLSCNCSAIPIVSRTSSQKSSDRWQFCRRTQPPFVVACCTKRLACISWPWPILISFMSKFLRLASDSIWFVGSEPIDRKQISGVCQSDSSTIFSKSRTTPSMNRSPIESAMYFLAWGSVRSGHQERMRRSLRKTSSDAPYPSGIGSSSGESFWSKY